MSALRRLLSCTYGGSAAEFGLVLPILVLFLMGTIDAGRLVWEINQAEKATQMGARMAVVTDVLDAGIATESYVGKSNGNGGFLTQGDRIPASAFGTLTCTSTSCTCTGTCPGSTGTVNAASFNAIVARIQDFKPDVAASNVQIEYTGSGLGYAGDPNGMEIAPIVTVRLTGLQFQPVTSLLLATVTLPDFRTSLTSEDSSGTSSN